MYNTRRNPLNIFSSQEAGVFSQSDYVPRLGVHCSVSVATCHCSISASHRLHIKILSWKHLLLSLLPPSAQPVSGGVLPEGPEEVPDQEDRLRGRHEDTLHQRSEPGLCFTFRTVMCSFSSGLLSFFVSRV